jgi:hypothetical protein
VRRRYGQIERNTAAKMFTYHEYNLFDHTIHNDIGTSDGVRAEDRQVVLFHMMQKEPAAPAPSKRIRTNVSQPVEKSKSRASRKSDVKASEAIVARPVKLQRNNTNAVISEASTSTKGKAKEPSATTPLNTAELTTSVPGGWKRKHATGVPPAITVPNPWSSDDESPATTPDEPGAAPWRTTIRSMSSVIVSSSVSAEAQQWLAAAHSAGNYRQSMPPAFAEQLLRDSTFQPGPRPRTFDAATATGWVFKESIHTTRTVRQIRSNNADRWHSSGGKKASRDLPIQA